MIDIKRGEEPFWKTMKFNKAGWDVPEEWQQELYNYIVMGLQPGSFHTALFANDLYGAAIKSHPINSWSAIMHFCRWLINVAPEESFGSYAKVEAWLKLSNAERRKILEDKQLVMTEANLMWQILQTPAEAL